MYIFQLWWRQVALLNDPCLLICSFFSEGGDQFEEESMDGQMSPDVASESLQSESDVFSSHQSTGLTYCVHGSVVFAHG